MIDTAAHGGGREGDGSGGGLAPEPPPPGLGENMGSCLSVAGDVKSCAVAAVASSKITMKSFGSIILVGRARREHTFGWEK